MFTVVSARERACEPSFSLELTGLDWLSSSCCSLRFWRADSLAFDLEAATATRPHPGSDSDGGDMGCGTNWTAASPYAQGHLLNLLPSTYYCGQECMKSHWPKHKVFHKQQKHMVLNWTRW